MKPHRLALFLTLLLPWVAQAQQPSFDCRRARSPAERAICANPSLSRLDRQLASVFQRKKAALPAAAARVLAAHQREFLDIRDQRLETSHQLPGLTVSLKDSLEERLLAVQAVITAPVTGVEGDWDSPSGHWSIRRRADGRYQVWANAVEQVAARGLCDVKGLATAVKGGLELRDAQRPDRGVYRMVRDGHVLRVDFEEPADSLGEGCGIGATLRGEFLAAQRR